MLHNEIIYGTVQCSIHASNSILPVHICLVKYVKYQYIDLYLENWRDRFYVQFG